MYAHISGINQTNRQQFLSLKFLLLAPFKILNYVCGMYTLWLKNLNRLIHEGLFNNFYNERLRVSGETPVHWYGMLGPSNPPPPLEKHSVFEVKATSCWLLIQTEINRITVPPSWEWHAEHIFQVRKTSFSDFIAFYRTRSPNFLQKLNFYRVLRQQGDPAWSVD